MTLALPGCARAATAHSPAVFHQKNQVLYVHEGPGWARGFGA